jgi:ABC-type multidrug transport system ATPase subunit
MKQRLKLILAFNNDVPVLFMDEPCSNLDESGINLYRHQLMQRPGKQLVIVATNQVAVEFPLQGTVLKVDEKKPV